MDQNYLQRITQEDNHTENNNISILDNDFIQTFYENNPQSKTMGQNMPFNLNQNFGLITSEGNPLTTNFNLGYNINQQNTQNPFGFGLSIAGGNTNQFGSNFLNQNNSNKQKNATIKGSLKGEEDKKNSISRNGSIDEQIKSIQTTQSDDYKVKVEKNQIGQTNTNNDNNNANYIINNSYNSNIQIISTNSANQNNNNQLKNPQKNTYINKINQLIISQEQLKKESQFIQSLQKEQQFSEVILMDQRMSESVRNRQQQQQDKQQPQNQQNTTNTNKSTSSNEASQKNIQEVDLYAQNSMHDKASESSSSNHQDGKCYEKKLNEKLVKNRESARNSRKRKKIYIELLETKLANITEELEKTKKSLDSNNEYLNKMSSQTQLTGLNLNQTQLIDKLEKCISSNGEENEINLLLDSLRFRLGATGKERITAINYFFKQILDICIPTHFRYLLHTADTAEDMFSDNPFSPESVAKRPDWRKELISYLDVSDSQRQKILKFKKKFKQEKKNLDDLIINLQNVKKSIQEKTFALEHMVDSLRNYMNPIQSAKFLSCMERNSFRKEISNVNLWHALKLEDQESDDFEDDNLSQNNETNAQLQLLSQQTQQAQQIYLQQQYNQPQLGFNNSGFLGDLQQSYGGPTQTGFQNQFYGGMNVQQNHGNLIGQNGQNPQNQAFTSTNSAFNYHQMNGNNIQNNIMMHPPLNEFSTKIETGQQPRKKIKANSNSQELI